MIDDGDDDNDDHENWSRHFDDLSRRYELSDIVG